MAIQRTSRGIEAPHVDVACEAGKGRPRHPGRIDPHALARALGWFGIGLGLAQIVAPRGLARLIGTRPRPALLRMLGVREMASGIAILARRRPAEAMWSRVAGDAMDLALLFGAMSSPRAWRGRIVAATASVLGVTALDVLSARQLSRHANGARDADGSIRVRNSVIVDRTPEELYRFWHDFQNLPRFMNHLRSVRVTGERRSHWVANAPAGATVEWDAELVEDRPNELISWRSLENADVENAGWVRFAPEPGDRGTLVTVAARYVPPAGAVGSTVAKLFGEEPGQQLQDDLRRFKQAMETGEVPTTIGQPSGRARATSAGW